MSEATIARHQWDGTTPTGIVSFTDMASGTAEDYALLDTYERQFAAALPSRIMDSLGQLEGSLGGYKISRLEHSLQTASRARKAGADVNWVVAALVHDLGDSLSPYNHSEYAASILQPYVPEEVTWVVLHHGLFQSYYYAHFHGEDRNVRDQYKDHKWFQLCADFCANWDQNSFDPGYPTDSLESFRADVEEVFGRAAWAPEHTAIGSQRLF